MGLRRKARILAFQTIYSWDINHSSIEELLDFSWKKEDINSDVADFARLLAGGTVENIEQIDSVIKKNIRNWEFERLAKVDLAILRTSIFEILFQEDVPAGVTINEAVEIAKSFGSDESYKFINGVLDNIRRTQNG
ncbi:transcription antitermination factor NusB [Spirochaeta isovalerica]|uniref:Transcription antitermination protein NusB n=1 Tax=Spirochaeta isovalerica TaxID=150 RepID=A0A841R5W9_9SPIO|nr:transcription antitermination factor NusB [Spirochaeta isovalerica]MBB6478547.1 N utilization substance protein B [Spirochaeta isovalerica]